MAWHHATVMPLIPTSSPCGAADVVGGKDGVDISAYTLLHAQYRHLPPSSLERV